MLRFLEYVARRMKEDRLNEFDANARSENLKTCVNYVFEYFNNYLDTTEVENRTVLQIEKTEKYRKQLHEFDLELQNWLTSIYSEYGIVLNRIIINILKQNEFFYLLNTDQEYRALSYDCYSKLIKKHTFLKDQTEMLFLFIKDYHRILNQDEWWSEVTLFSEEINSWIEDARIKHQVNLMAFARNWINYIEENEDLWPATNRKKNLEGWRQYDYDYKKESNRFNLNSLYNRIPKKSFIRGKKQELEILMMYFWLHEIDTDDEYWDEYLKKVMPAIK